MKHPESVDECVYFTRRKFNPKGRVMAWAFRKPCPKCKAPMAKPNKRAATYDCPECGYSEDKKTHEDSLVVNVEYECPECGHAGETTTEYQRKSWKGVKAYVFQCQQCNAKIGLTKKMKEPKK